MFKNFSVLKAVWKFALGFVGTFVGLIVANPSILTNLLPEHIATMTVAGFAVETIDFLNHRLNGKK